MRAAKNLAALLSATVVMAGNLASVAHADERLTPMDKQFVTMVAQGNIAEIKTSQLALKKSSNRKVRMIATMLIQQHGKSQQDLKSVARLHLVSLPADTDPKHKAEYRALTRLSGVGFDKAYMRGQVRDHNATVALFNKELAGGNETHVLSFAAKYLPDIQNHTGMIHNVASNLGIPVAAPMKTAEMSKMAPMSAQ
ncbi:MAG: DUF4142 domain-containing protein [Cytophagales bacterium]|nr:DUF4142 domain-containing protein [Armatimonadota bacterium]